jgi:hypothetical protein
MAHEISHVIAGESAEHGDEWDKIFTDLQNKWTEVIKKSLE